MSLSPSHRSVRRAGGVRSLGMRTYHRLRRLADAARCGEETEIVPRTRSIRKQTAGGGCLSSKVLWFGLRFAALGIASIPFGPFFV